jgi:hypothetical protein
MPNFFNIVLLTDTFVPLATINLFSELEEIIAGNGYTSGGYQVAPNVTDFDNISEDDPGGKALIQMKDITWTAVGGPLPASGGLARYAAMLDNNASIPDREVLAWWDLLDYRQVSQDQPFTLLDLELQLS